MNAIEYIYNSISSNACSLSKVFRFVQGRSMPAAFREVFPRNNANVFMSVEDSFLRARFILTSHSFRFVQGAYFATQYRDLSLGAILCRANDCTYSEASGFARSIEGDFYLKYRELYCERYATFLWERYPGSNPFLICPNMLFSSTRPSTYPARFPPISRPIPKVMATAARPNSTCRTPE